MILKTSILNQGFTALY